MFSLIKRKGSYDERVKLMIETHSTGNTPFLSPARPPPARARACSRGCEASLVTKSRNPETGYSRTPDRDSFYSLKVPISAGDIPDMSPPHCR